MIEKYRKYLIPTVVVVAVVAASLIIYSLLKERQPDQIAEEPEPKLILYGIEADELAFESGEIQAGETMGKILNGFGVSAQVIDRLDKASVDVFPLSKVRAGNKYMVFFEEDSLGQRTLRHLAYERNNIDYVVFNIADDTVTVIEGAKEVTPIRERDTATITSSLWGAIMEAELPYELAAQMEDIYQWSIDFFGIQEGDRFTVIYDRMMVDTVEVGLGRVWGARFDHGGKSYYAIPFKQDDKIAYWDENGNSLRKALLKAPLKYSRISSRFSRARLHPIYKVYRPHLGVDYAAPAGTPVQAVADGVVIFKGWGGGGGNTLKIKHAGNLQSGYLHLRAFAKGIQQGSRVQQGQIIGYVGSTGASTGPHLDFRIWRNGTPIDPLKVPSEPAEPIKPENKSAFVYVRDRIMAELQGDSIPADRIIVQLDSLPAEAYTLPDSLLVGIGKVDSTKTEPKADAAEPKADAAEPKKE